jgi:hypothetical protein
MLYLETMEEYSSMNQDASLGTALKIVAGLQFSKVSSVPIKDRLGYQKIVKTAHIARGAGVDHVWIDTCCIDKTSSAELQEAINTSKCRCRVGARSACATYTNFAPRGFTVWKWYQRSSYCVVFLDDSAPADTVREGWGGFYCDPSFLENNLHRSRWITRGWTLQELIAPRNVGFYDSTWRYVCDKRDKLGLIEEITTIPQYVLSTGDVSQSSIAQRMSWAANRQTTRMEDMAYSLMGIFGVHMPMLYGEGENAFQRLQEEIIKSDPDDSILAWSAEIQDNSVFRGALARSPQEFGPYCQGIVKGEDSSLTLETNRSLRLHGYWTPRVLSHLGDVSIKLKAQWPERQRPVVLAGIEVPDLSTTGLSEASSHYIRSHVVGPFDEEKTMPDLVRKEIWIALKPSIPWNFRAASMHCFRLQRSLTESSWDQEYTVSCLWPRENWIAQEKVLLINRQSSLKFFGVLELRPRSGAVEHVALNLVLGFDASKANFWWATTRSDVMSWPDSAASTSTWQDALETRYLSRQGASEKLTNGVLTCRENWCRTEHFFRCQARPGIYEDRISVIVSIAGLTR